MKRKSYPLLAASAVVTALLLAGGSSAYASNGFLSGLLGSILTKVSAVVNKTPVTNVKQNTKKEAATRISNKSSLASSVIQKKKKIIAVIIDKKSNKPGNGGNNGGSLPVVGSENCEVFYAGQHIAVGSVCLTISDDMVYIDYIMENGWKLNEAHAWIGDSLASAPKAGNGNPIPGQFPLKGKPSGVTTYTFSAPLSQLNINADTVCETDLYVAAHGSVKKESQGESAWAGTTRFTQKGNWATYFKATPECEPEDPVDPPSPYDPDAGLPQGCFATFAVNSNNDLSFATLYGAGNKGWLHEADMSFDSIDAPMSTGAGVTLGSLEMFVIDGELLVQIGPSSNYEIRSINIYAGALESFEPKPVAEYGIGQSGLNQQITDTYLFDSGISAGPAELVIHAQICAQGSPGGPA